MDLPMNANDARLFSAWIRKHFAAPITAELAGTPFDLNHACAIACQETGIYVYPFAKVMSPQEALARCVFDASGDAPGTSRGAFPKTTADFRARYGDQLTTMLIAEANLTRAARHYSPRDWVYRGYGIFQYDLQAITRDETFFRNKEWYRIDACAKRLGEELRAKYAKTNDLWDAIRAYNGSGPKAQAYAANVREFYDIVRV